MASLPTTVSGTACPAPASAAPMRAGIAPAPRGRRVRGQRHYAAVSRPKAGDRPLREPELLYLARGGERQVGRADQEHVGGHLEPGQLRPALRDDLPRVRLGALAGHDPGAAHLAQPGVRHADDERLHHVRPPVEALLDLGQHHQLAAALVQVLRPAGQHQGAVGPHVAEVAGAQPPARQRDVGGRLGLLAVAGRDDGAAGGQLALGARREVRAGHRVDGLVRHDLPAQRGVAGDAARLGIPDGLSRSSTGPPGRVNVLAAEVSVMP